MFCVTYRPGQGQILYFLVNASSQPLDMAISILIGA